MPNGYLVLELDARKCYNRATNGMSPSGKAVGSGPTIRGFESLHPSQENINDTSSRMCHFYITYHRQD